MGLVTLVLVFLVSFLAGMGSVMDEHQFHRPIIACTLMGLVLGDIKTGIILGGSLELIALGWMVIGAAMPPDCAIASTVATVIVIASGMSVQEGIALAIPLAVAGQALNIFIRTINVFFAHRADGFAKKANFRGIEAMHFSALILQGLRVAIPTVIVASIAGTDVVINAINAIPDVITGGLQVAGGFIVVVGYAMVINMMEARALMPFFFIGFLVAAFIPDFNLVGLGILGAGLAVVYVQLSPSFNRQTEPASVPATVSAASNFDDDELE